MKGDEQLVLTVAEAAAILRVSRNTCYSLVTQGRVPSVRLGRRLLIPRRSLDALLDVQKPPAVG